MRAVILTTIAVVVAAAAIAAQVMIEAGYGPGVTAAAITAFAMLLGFDVALVASGRRQMASGRRQRGEPELATIDEPLPVVPPLPTPPLAAPPLGHGLRSRGLRSRRLRPSRSAGSLSWTWINPAL